MSCVPEAATFRLLDALVGWDPASVQGLAGLDELAGLTLAPLPTGLDPAELARFLPPAQLARGCGPCEWWLVTPCPPPSRLLRLDSCSGGWKSVWSDACAPAVLRCGVAVAVHRDRVAVADAEAGMVWLWRRRGAELRGAIPLANPGPLAFAPWGEWLVVDRNGPRLLRFDPAGGPRGPFAAALPEAEAVDRLGVDSRCRVWLVTRRDSALKLWVAGRGEAVFRPATVEELHAAFPPTGIEAATEEGFCLALPGTASRCYSWYGRPLPELSQPPVPMQRYQKQGQLLTRALDSGIPRCRWHRVRIDAEVPAGTNLELAVSSHEDPEPSAQGLETDPAWQGFDPGLPHPSDWQKGPDGTLDLLVQQPPGRYLFLRLRLTGDGRQTPRVRRVRLDFPRQTSLDLLPVTYREDPRAEDFSERFLALFDAVIEDLDRAIERFPALFDVDGVPAGVLPWLGGFLDVAMDPAWDTARRRRILHAVPELYRRRGTVEGLAAAIRLLFDLEPVIQEAASERLWGALGRARLNAVRLFGPARARWRLGCSILGQAPLHSYGNPDRDPLAAPAHRFRLLLPPGLTAARRSRLAQVVERLKPAHTVAAIRSGGAGLVVGHHSAVGVDTALTPMPPPLLGTPGLRLGRASVLWSGGRRTLGRTAAVGITTVME